jgi:hypothetical protein
MTGHRAPVVADRRDATDLGALGQIDHRGPPSDDVGHQDVALRLGLWLADVAAEAALAAPAPGTTSTPVAEALRNAGRAGKASSQESAG